MLFRSDITDTSQFRGSILHTPVSQEIVVVVTASKLVAADTLPPDAGGVDGHAEQGWGWQPGWGRERERDKRVREIVSENKIDHFS